MTPNVVQLSPYGPHNVDPEGSKWKATNAFGYRPWPTGHQSGWRECGRLPRRKAVICVLAVHTIYLLIVVTRSNYSLSFGTEFIPHFPNTSVVYEGFCVLPNVFHSNQVNESNRITQVLHISSNFLDYRIIEQVKNWQAPVSLSVVLIHKEDHSCVKTKLSQLIKDNPDIATFLSVHFIFPVDWNPNCVASMLSSSCAKEKYTEENVAKYPANIARNVGRMFSNTKYVLVADFEHLFSVGFEEDVRKVAKGWLSGADARRVLVYRIFEIETNVPKPKTIADLKILYDKEEAVVFHSKFYKGAHDIPGLDEWFRDNGTGSGIFKEAVVYSRFSWEPQFVSRNDIPYHDVNFPFLIRDNTCLRWELCRAEYKFDVLSRHFMYHRGIKRSRGITLSSKSAFKSHQKFQKALIVFKKRMDESYPDSKRKCPDPRA